jgi:hypothetical protein
MNMTNKERRAVTDQANREHARALDCKLKLEGGTNDKGDLYLWPDTGEEYMGGHAVAMIYGESGYNPRAVANLLKAAPDLLAALEGLLAQSEGPAMVYGDGRGNDGTKTGLSHEEFNALRKNRIDAARAAISKATK